MKEKTQSTATALAVAQPQGEVAQSNTIPIRSFDDISRIGIAVAKSGWFGPISQSTGELIAMTMYDEKIGPAKFKKKYHVMVNPKTGECKLTIATRSTVSSFKMLGGKMKLHEVSDDKCDITFIYGGNELRHCVTLQKYIDNGVAISSSGALKDNWAKFPGDMLYARCCSFAIRKVCPEADDGLYTTEEVADFDDAPAAPAPKPEPIKIDKAEVASRIAKAEPAATQTPVTPTPTPQPEVVDAEAEVVEDDGLPKYVKPRLPPSDASLCPIEGKFYNVPFADMEPDILMFVLMPSTASKHPELTDAHIEAAKVAARAKGMEV